MPPRPPLPLPEWIRDEFTSCAGAWRHAKDPALLAAWLDDANDPSSTLRAAHVTKKMVEALLPAPDPLDRDVAKVNEEVQAIVDGLLDRAEPPSRAEVEAAVAAAEARIDELRDRPPRKVYAWIENNTHASRSGDGLRYTTPGVASAWVATLRGARNRLLPLVVFTRGVVAAVLDLRIARMGWSPTDERRVADAFRAGIPTPPTAYVEPPASDFVTRGGAR